MIQLGHKVNIKCLLEEIGLIFVIDHVLKNNITGPDLQVRREKFSSMLEIDVFSLRA